MKKTYFICSQMMDELQDCVNDFLEDYDGDICDIKFQMTKDDYMIMYGVMIVYEV